MIILIIYTFVAIVVVAVGSNIVIDHRCVAAFQKYNLIILMFDTQYAFLWIITL